MGILAAYSEGLSLGDLFEVLYIDEVEPQPEGSRKKKFTFFSVEAPVWQRAKARAYQKFKLSQRSQSGCIGT